MRKSKNSLKFRANLELTPLIDVVFLLIIFFMLSSSFILQPGIKVELPESSISEPQEEKNAEVTITKSGVIFYNAERISKTDLITRFKELGKEKNVFLIIKADGEVLHQNVVEIMTLARENKVTKLAVATKPAD